MTHQFDTYDESYCEVVQSSIDFSGLPHSFFHVAKADMIGELINARFGANSKPAALDVGCGIGMFHHFGRHLFGRLCGVDQSANCINRARRENPSVEYSVNANDRLPFDDAEFDLSYAICVLHHVPPACWQSFLGEMRRVTRPGGIVCIIEHNPLNPLTRLSVMRCEFDKDAVLLRARKTERLMRRVGLNAPQVSYFLLLPSAAPLARRFERRLAWLPLGAQYIAVGQV